MSAALEAGALTSRLTTWFSEGDDCCSDQATVEFYLNTYSTKREIIDAIRRVRYDYGHTNTAAALRRTRTEVYTPIHGDRSSEYTLLL